MNAESSTIKHVSDAFPPPVPSTCACITFLQVYHSAHRSNYISRHLRKRENLHNGTSVLRSARHAINRTTLLVLRDGQPTRLLHVSQTLSPITSHARHDQTRGARPKLLRYRPDQHVYRRPMTVHQRPIIQPDFAPCRGPLDLHVTVARRNQSPARYRQITVPRFTNLEITNVVQPPRHHRCKTLRHVLNDHDSRIQIRRQPRQQITQRVRPARGSPNRDDLVLGAPGRRRGHLLPGWGLAVR